jgi:hypothetical protein
VLTWVSRSLCPLRVSGFSVCHTGTRVGAAAKGGITAAGRKRLPEHQFCYWELEQQFAYRNVLISNVMGGASIPESSLLSPIDHLNCARSPGPAEVFVRKLAM